MEDIQMKEAQLKKSSDALNLSSKEVDQTFTKISETKTQYLRCIFQLAINNEKQRRRTNLFYALLIIGATIVGGLLLLIVHWGLSIGLAALVLGLFILVRSTSKVRRLAAIQRRQQYYDKYREIMERMGLMQGFRA